MSNHAHDRAAQEKLSAEVFARLHEQDIEQFYAHYQLWVLRRRVPLLEKQVEVLREHIDENQQRLQSLRPSALAQAVLVRLQSSGVNNIELLDLMLERGEDWLDRMMQRLDYCEQVEDFVEHFVDDPLFFRGVERSFFFTHQPRHGGAHLTPHVIFGEQGESLQVDPG